MSTTISNSHDKVVRLRGKPASKQTDALHPFLEVEEERPGLEDYREARSRTQALLSDYRMLLGRLRDTTAALKETPRPVANG